MPAIERRVSPDGAVRRCARVEVLADGFDYIERFCNLRRRRFTIGQVGPAGFERRFATQCTCPGGPESPGKAGKEITVRKLTTNASHWQVSIAAALFAALAIAGADARAQTGSGVASQSDSDAEVAKAALNPIAAMISLPLQYNYDRNIGPQEAGHRHLLNVQPVIPFSLGQDWNLISRTIVPLIDQDDVVPGTGGQSGIGDITQSLFFSPKKASADGWIWGVGPVIYLPTASDDLLGADKWGLGPTAVFLKQEHGWTYGALVNHLWSVGGSGSSDINSTFLQPFLQYTTNTLTTFGVNTESTYDWESRKWSVPIQFLVSQFFRIGDQRLSLQAGARYWAEGPDSGPHGWGARVQLTFLFPK